MKAYINYPAPHITIHWKDACSEVRKRRSPQQRVVRIGPTTVCAVFAAFATRKYRFAAKQGVNDMWLDVTLQSPAHEQAVVYAVESMLGVRYSPLRAAPIITHACTGRF